MERDEHVQDLESLGNGWTYFWVSTLGWRGYRKLTRAIYVWCTIVLFLGFVKTYNLEHRRGWKAGACVPKLINRFDEYYYLLQSEIVEIPGRKAFACLSPRAGDHSWSVYNNSWVYLPVDRFRPALWTCSYCRGSPTTNCNRQYRLNRTRRCWYRPRLADAGLIECKYSKIEKTYEVAYHDPFTYRFPAVHIPVIWVIQRMNNIWTVKLLFLMQTICFWYIIIVKVMLRRRLNRGRRIREADLEQGIEHKSA